MWYIACDENGLSTSMYVYSGERDETDSASNWLALYREGSIQWVPTSFSYIVYILATSKVYSEK